MPLIMPIFVIQYAT